MTADTKAQGDMVARIRHAIHGTETWQVMNAAEDGYCMSFSSSEFLNPQRACERWLAEQDPAWLQRNGYHAVRSIEYSGAERLALEAADLLAALRSPGTQEGEPSDAVLQRTSELMRAIDAYAFDYAEEGKLGKSRIFVERELRAALAQALKERPQGDAVRTGGEGSC